MRLFEYLDEALLQAEQSKPRVSRTVKIWPSTASAELYDKTGGNLVGKCHRAAVFSMIGEPQTNPTDETGARKFRLGRACEADMVELAKHAGIFVASGVRAAIPDIDMTLELDLVVIDPTTRKATIVECKSISGYFGVKEVIQLGNPKRDAIMQLLIYLNEFRTGAVLRTVIDECLEKQLKASDRVDLLSANLEAEIESTQPNPDEIERLKSDLAKARFELQRNRIEVDLENLKKMDNGPLAGKLAYEDRGDCDTREFDISLYQVPETNKHVPMIDQEPYPWFDLESVYARFRLLKERYATVRDEAIRRLAERGITEPSARANWKEINSYWDNVGEELRKLPREFLPPAEYEYKYATDKIEAMYRKGMISKSKYEKWKKQNKGFETIGDWQCAFCAYRKKCLPMEYPELAYMNLETMATEEVA